MRPTETERYALHYPDGTRVADLAWDEAALLRRSAPKGTRWCDARGVVLGVIAGTREDVTVWLRKLAADDAAIARARTTERS